MFTHSKWIAGKGRTLWLSCMLLFLFLPTQGCSDGTATMNLKVTSIPTPWPSYMCFPKYLQQSLDRWDR